MAEGGFPEAQGLDAALRIELLQGYVDTLLFRDVVERFELSQVTVLRWLVRQCLRNPTGSFSIHKMTQDLKSQGLGVARDAVTSMLGHLADAFLLSAVPLATESERQRNSNPRKIYPADPGLIPAFDASGRMNLGHALETAVLNELERRKADTGYVKTAEGWEVDYFARYRGAGEELIQVCANLRSVETTAREVRAIKAAVTSPRARSLLLVPDRDSAREVEVPGIIVQPAYDGC